MNYWSGFIQDTVWCPFYMTTTVKEVMILDSKQKYSL